MKYDHTELSDAHITLSHLLTCDQVFRLVIFSTHTHHILEPLTVPGLIVHTFQSGKMF